MQRSGENVNCSKSKNVHLLLQNNADAISSYHQNHEFDPAYGEVYKIIIQFVSDLRYVDSFLQILRILSPNKNWLPSLTIDESGVKHLL